MKRYLKMSLWVFAAIFLLLILYIVVYDLVRIARMPEGFLAILEEYGIQTVFAQIGTDIYHNLSGILVMSVILSMIVLVPLRLLFNKITRKCKSCHRLFAYKKVGTFDAGSTDISVLMELKDRSRDGHIIGTHEQYVPGTRTTYEVAYKCKYCGDKKSRIYSRDSANI